MCSHMKPKVNDKFKEWMKRNYDKHGEVNSNRGKLHEYLGMTFDFTEKWNVKIYMDEYVEMIISDLPMKISKSDTYLATDGNDIFEKGNSKSLGKK